MPSHALRMRSFFEIAYGASLLTESTVVCHVCKSTSSANGGEGNVCPLCLLWRHERCSEKANSA
eukprot:4133039-Alexandrium_andersonii.AAC.1